MTRSFRSNNCDLLNTFIVVSPSNSTFTLCAVDGTVSNTIPCFPVDHDSQPHLPKSSPITTPTCTPRRNAYGFVVSLITPVYALDASMSALLFFNALFLRCLSITRGMAPSPRRSGRGLISYIRRCNRDVHTPTNPLFPCRPNPFHEAQPFRSPRLERARMHHPTHQFQQGKTTCTSHASGRASSSFWKYSSLSIVLYPGSLFCARMGTRSFSGMTRSDS